MLALPSAFHTVGLSLGVVLVIVSGLLSAYGLNLLAKTADFVSRRNETAHDKVPASFFGCASLTYPRLAFWINVAIAVKCFGVACSYLIIIGDLVPQILIGFGYHDDVFLNRRIWITLATVFVVFPMAMMRKLDALKYTSVVAMMAVAYLVVIVVHGFVEAYFQDPQVFLRPENGWDTVDFGFKWSGALTSLPIFVFAFTCHQNLFSVYEEIETPTVPRMNIVITQSIGISAAVYQVVGILGYLTFGSSVLPNVILNYASGRLVLGGRIFLVILQVCSYPLLSHPCRHCLNEVLPKPRSRILHRNEEQQGLVADAEEGRGELRRRVRRAPDPADEVEAEEPEHQDMSFSRLLMLTAAIVLGTWLVAVSVTQLDLVLALVGASGSTAVSFILPGLFHIGMYGRRKSTVALVVLGFTVMFVCVYVNMKKALQN